MSADLCLDLRSKSMPLRVHVLGTDERWHLVREVSDCNLGAVRYLAPLSTSAQFQLKDECVCLVDGAELRGAKVPHCSPTECVVTVLQGSGQPFLEVEESVGCAGCLVVEVIQLRSQLVQLRVILLRDCDASLHENVGRLATCVKDRVSRPG